MSDLGPGAAPPKNWRVAQNDDGRAIDPFTPAERKAMADAQEATRKADREADKGAESLFDDPQREPDALDGIISALMLEPRLAGLEAPEDRKARLRRELVQSRENAKKRAAGDIEERQISPEASRWIADALKPDEDDEDAEYARQEAELERELEAEQRWEED